MHPDDFEKDMVRDYLGAEPGVFVEVGANHPTDGSQTHLFELAGWRGILVEPQQKFQDSLRRERPRSTVFQAVCTSPERVGPQTLHIPVQDGFATLEPNKDDFGIRYGATETVEGRTVFDPRLEAHNHFIDDDSGQIEDVPWDAVRVGEVKGLKGYEVREYMVVMRGRKLGGSRMQGRSPGPVKKR